MSGTECWVPIASSALSAECIWVLKIYCTLSAECTPDRALSVQVPSATEDCAWTWSLLPSCHHGHALIDWCCFYYFLINSLVALLEALFARRIEQPSQNCNSLTFYVTSCTFISIIFDIRVKKKIVAISKVKDVNVEVCEQTWSTDQVKHHECEG